MSVPLQERQFDDGDDERALFAELCDIVITSSSVAPFGCLR
jgi:hypothetical protein